MKKKEAQKYILQRTESRNIVKEIVDYGVTDQQKLDIIYFLSLELENNKLMKDIANLLKNYRTKFNENEEKNIVNDDKPNKLILD